MGPDTERAFPGDLLRDAGIDAWGVACNEPRLPLAPELPRAVSLLKCLRPAEVEGVEDGPTQIYYRGYRRLNEALAKAADLLAQVLEGRGFRCQVVAPTGTKTGDRLSAGVFSHKAAATQAGLGWIGKTALFVSPEFGPRVRLATVFTDMLLEPGKPVRSGRCGKCRICVDACPAGAGRDVDWVAGMERDRLLDARACMESESRLTDWPVEPPDFPGCVCGICVAVCPFGRAAARREPG
jgi:epoxyqueuosine reductase